MSATLLQPLVRTGLTPKEAKLYLACVQFGAGAYVHQLVKASGMKRSTVDVILERLIAQKLILKLRTDRRYQYRAVDPEDFYQQQQIQLAELHGILPALKKLQHGGQENTGIVFYSGAAGLRKAYHDLLTAMRYSPADPPELLSFSSAPQIMRLYPDMQKDFIDKRVKHGVWYRAIAPKSSAKVVTWTNDEKYLREVTFVDDNVFPFDMTLEIYGDRILIYSAVRPVDGFMLRNAQMAASLRVLFKLLWSQLEKPRPKKRT